MAQQRWVLAVRGAVNVKDHMNGLIKQGWVLTLGQLNHEDHGVCVSAASFLVEIYVFRKKTGSKTFVSPMDFGLACAKQMACESDKVLSMSIY